MKKNYIVIICVIAIIISCEKDDVIINNGEIGTFIVSIHDALKYLPLDKFQDASSVRYLNSTGDVRELEIQVFSGKVQKEFDNIGYETEQVQIKLIDPKMPNGELLITVSANYSTKGDPPLQFVWATLLTSSNGGYVPSARLDGTGKAVICNFTQSTELNDKTFRDVYYNFTAPSHIVSYSEIYYNKEFGIVAYRDQNDELWVFDRFE